MDYEKAYKEALEKAKKLATDLPNGRNDRLYHVDDLEHIFPELKESEDERMKGAIIATIHLYYGEPLEDEAKEMIAWLEEQEQHKKFRDSIQVGDKVTKNEDGVLVNLSQLNRVAKKDERQGEQKPEWSDEDKRALNDAIVALSMYANGNIPNILPSQLLEDVEQLKSLRPQNRWKPTEEQLIALELACSYEDGNNLRELLEQLKE